MSKYTVLYDPRDSIVEALIGWDVDGATCVRTDGKWIPVDDSFDYLIEGLFADTISEEAIPVFDEADQGGTDLNRSDLKNFII